MNPLLQRRLEEVSRSFALCIPQLAPPFRDQVALAYLLFRLLDTVEDAPFADRGLQQRQFERMRGFLREMPGPAGVSAFVSDFPPQLTKGERALLDDTGALLEIAYAQSDRVRGVMFDAIDRMAVGMAAYARRPAPLRLVDVEDVSRYCCFVAGLVGEMLTRLWGLGRGEPAPGFRLAYHFGLFLQKVNILKDQQEDEAAGRFFIPDRRALLASLRSDARGALGYLQAIPKDERGYRTFCAWALMLGLVTIAQLDEPRVSRRSATQELLAKTAAVACDDVELDRLFAELMPVLPEADLGAPREKPESAAWFRTALRAPLADRDLADLGIERVAEHVPRRAS
jgi:phytoene/squalene synthetase